MDPDTIPTTPPPTPSIGNPNHPLDSSPRGLHLVMPSGPDVESGKDSASSFPSTAFPPYDPRNSLLAPSTPSVLMPADSDGRRTVVVLGSGDFGLALGARLAQANYRVVVASRDPNKTRARVEGHGCEAMTHGAALGQSGVVVVAVPFQHVTSLPLPDLNNKILVDVSNRDPRTRDPSGRSQAEHLQQLVPQARVVKALNVLSAYTLSRGVRGSKEIPICGDDPEARSIVANIVRDLRLDPNDLGGLAKAREVEGLPFAFFDEWRLALWVSLGLWLFCFVFSVFKWQLCDNLANLHQPNTTWDWSGFNDLAQGNVSIACAMTSITLLALCYLPGVIAAYIQLFRGTKYSAFPTWLDRWLKARKHMGVLMLWNGIVHGFMVVAGSGDGVGAVGAVGVGEGDSWAWRGPTFMACGVLTLLLAGVLGVASLPSVGASMTWREFSFVQSRVGWLVLVLATGHVVFNAWDGLIQNNFSCYFLPSIGQISVVVPVVTLVMKAPLLLPCLDQHLTRIRQGYERVTPPSALPQMP